MLIAVAAGVAACGPSLDDELAPLDPADQSCHALPDAVNAKLPEVAHTFGVDLKEESRALTIGVDSANRVRSIAASTHRKIGTRLTVRASTALFDSVGTMSKTVRNVTDGDIDEKSVTSRGAPLTATEMEKLRALAAAAVKLCVR